MENLLFEKLNKFFILFYCFKCNRSLKHSLQQAWITSAVLSISARSLHTQCRILCLADAPRFHRMHVGNMFPPAVFGGQHGSSRVVERAWLTSRIPRWVCLHSQACSTPRTCAPAAPGGEPPQTSSPRRPCTWEVVARVWWSTAEYDREHERDGESSWEVCANKMLSWDHRKKTQRTSGHV